MLPFDIHDPALDPMCASGTAAGKFAWGTAYNGHFDQSGHVTGEVRVRGKRYAIDCVSTMDHSWGPRPERGKPNMSWLHAHVDDKTVLQPPALEIVFERALHMHRQGPHTPPGALRTLNSWFQPMDSRPSAAAILHPAWEQVKMRG